MDASRLRWAAALGVETDDVSFGPSTSANTYALAQAMAAVLGPGDNVVVTNQDHEANTGAIRREAERAGATVLEWRIDPDTGLLALDDLADLLSVAGRTRVVTMPHCSNIVGMENPVAEAAAMAHQAGARIVVDGVSFAPHGLPDVAALGVDAYLFSLYKVYSVHQGVFVTRNGLLDELPNQGHGFNATVAARRLTPAGPDHAQEAAAGAVLDYVEASHRHHTGTEAADLRHAMADATRRWQAHEAALLAPLLDWLAARSDVRVLGPIAPGSEADGRHRCPTVAFVPATHEPDAVARQLGERGVWCGAGTFYAPRVIEGMGEDVERGVVRLSFVHYTSEAEVDRALTALEAVLS